MQCVVSVAFLGFLGLLFWGYNRWESQPARTIGVSVLQIAIDARARRFVQEALAKEAARSDTASGEGLLRLLSAATSVLGATKAAWIYGGAQRFDLMPAAEAQATHARLALDARARFQTELLRAADGTTRTEAAPDLVAREHEGEGVVVVTLVVAAEKRLAAIDPAQVGELERLLAQLSGLSATELVALELIWSPSAEEDRMSTAELEARYPELGRLTEVGGRVFCGHCAGPHAAELPRCPHCGAPVDRLPPGLGALP